MKKRLLFAIPVFFIAFILLAALVGVRPIAISRENSVEKIGLVTGISEGGAKDAVIMLSGDPSLYYINRGYERGFTRAGLQSQLLGKQVKISCARHWTIFNTAAVSTHITEVKLGKETVFSELN